MNALISEKIACKKGFFSVGSALVESERIHLKNVLKARFLVRLETGAGTTLSLKLKEHDAASGGNSKDVVVSMPHIVRVDGAAGIKKDALSVADIAISELDTAAGFAMIEVDLRDITDGYEYVSLEMAAPGAVRQVCCIAELDAQYGPAYEQE